MTETYTRKEAMKRLGLQSIRTFQHLESRYTDAFVIVQEIAGPYMRPRYDKAVLYDKDVLDKFAERRDHFNEQRL